MATNTPPMLGHPFPDFEAESSIGKLKWSEFSAGSWAILLSHPSDFTPVCTTELGTVEKYFEKFDSRGVRVAAISCDGVDSHKAWTKDILALQGIEGKETLSYPIIADPTRQIALMLGMLDPNALNSDGIPMSARAVFIVNPKGKLALSLLYPATTGRNFDEILRVVDSLKLTAEHMVATPAQWQRGAKCMVLPTLSDAEAEAKFAKGFEKVAVPSEKGYLRFTPDPRID